MFEPEVVQLAADAVIAMFRIDADAERRDVARAEEVQARLDGADDPVLDLGDACEEPSALRDRLPAVST